MSRGAVGLALSVVLVGGCVSDELKLVGAYAAMGATGGATEGVTLSTDSGAGASDGTTLGDDASSGEGTSTTAVPPGDSSTSTTAATMPCDDGLALACADFEDALEDPWTISMNAERTTERAHGGTYSLLVDTPQPTDRSFIGIVLDEALVDGEFAARSFVYIPGDVDIEAYSILYEMMQVPSETNQRMSLDLRHTNGLMFVNSLGSGMNLIGDGLVPRDRWVCIEARMTVGTAGAVQIRVDDEIVLAVGPGVDTLPELGISRFTVGSLRGTDGSAPVRYFIDDVVFARGPIGCD